jgi:hypothetical protein
MSGPTIDREHRELFNLVDAPLNLVYVARGERMREISASDRRLYAFADTGFYLFCASERLATVFQGTIDYGNRNRAMQLGTDQFVTFAQTVVFPLS